MDLLHGNTAAAELEVLAEKVALALLLADGLYLSKGSEGEVIGGFVALDELGGDILDRLSACSVLAQGKDRRAEEGQGLLVILHLDQVGHAHPTVVIVFNAQAVELAAALEHNAHRNCESKEREKYFFHRKTPPKSNGVKG